MCIVVSTPRSASTGVRFAAPPWHDDHPQRLDLERLLPADHRARQIDAAVARLDLSVVLACYHGTGSLPHPPDLLLCVVL